MCSICCMNGAVVGALAFDSGLVPLCGLSLLLVVALLQGFISGYPGFPPSTKTNTPNSNLTRIENPHENQLKLMWPSSLNIVCYLLMLIYLFIITHIKKTPHTVPAADHNLHLHVLRELLLTLSLPIQDKQLTITGRS